MTFEPFFGWFSLGDLNPHHRQSSQRSVLGGLRRGPGKGRRAGSIWRPHPRKGTPLPPTVGLVHCHARYEVEMFEDFVWRFLCGGLFFRGELFSALFGFFVAFAGHSSYSSPDVREWHNACWPNVQNGHQLNRNLPETQTAIGIKGAVRHGHGKKQALRKRQRLVPGLLSARIIIPFGNRLFFYLWKHALKRSSASSGGSVLSDRITQTDTW